jgi:hypothetical protein
VGGMDEQLERIRQPGYLGELKDRPIEDLRAMRDDCQAVETQLSYIRRLVQGRIDIVSSELQRRRDGGDPGDLGNLLVKLPEILSERTRGPGQGRLPRLLEPGDVRGEMADRLDAIVATGHLDSLPDVDDHSLDEVRERLSELEADISAKRHDVFGRIDALQAELIRRYRSGEATVESLLHD